MEQRTGGAASSSTFGRHQARNTTSREKTMSDTWKWSTESCWRRLVGGAVRWEELTKFELPGRRRVVPQVQNEPGGMQWAAGGRLRNCAVRHARGGLGRTRIFTPTQDRGRFCFPIGAKIKTPNFSQIGRLKKRRPRKQYVPSNNKLLLVCADGVSKCSSYAVFDIVMDRLASVKKVELCSVQTFG